MSAGAKVIVYSQPFCGYCTAAKRLLDRKGIAYTEIDVMLEPERREEMIERTGRQTVPQIFFGERHIGGFDELNALDKSGGLEKMLAAESRAP
ncbi:MAG TPA: glutaredoxin 3 [Gammaproteobacteria bacterium]|jgi:glutaredoxin 3